MSVTWANLVTSSAVAVVTTILVEYAAKPTLEARKERILENSRRSRDLLTQLMMLESRISMLPGEFQPGGREPREVINRLSDEIREMAASNPLMAVLPSEIAFMTQYACGRIVGYLKGYRVGWKQSGGDEERLSDTNIFSDSTGREISTTYLLLAIQYLSTKKVRFRVRWRLIEVARQARVAVENQHSTGRLG